MVEILKGDFRIIAETAELQGNLEGAAVVREIQEDVARRLAEKGLDGITRASAAELRRNSRTARLALVAREALDISGDEFVHSSPLHVAQALRAKRAGDPRLSYSDHQLRKDVRKSGREMLNVVVEAAGVDAPDKTLAEVLGSEEVKGRMPEAWLETLDYARENLPEDTTVLEVATLLTDFTELWVKFHKPVDAKLQVARQLITWRKQKQLEPVSNVIVTELREPSNPIARFLSRLRLSK